jgi:hypothetical protein
MTHVHDWDIVEVDSVGPVKLVCECGESRRVDSRPDQDHAEKIKGFSRRTFTGQEVLEIADYLGATINAAEAVARLHRNQ